MDMKFLFVIFIVWAGLCYANDICEKPEGCEQHDENMEGRNLMEADALVEKKQKEIDEEHALSKIPHFHDGDEDFQRIEFVLSGKSTGIIKVPTWVMYVPDGMSELMDYNADSNRVVDEDGDYFRIEQPHWDEINPSFGANEVSYLMNWMVAARANKVNIKEEDGFQFLKKPLPNDANKRNWFTNQYTDEQKDAFITTLTCSDAAACSPLMEACNWAQSPMCKEYVAAVIAGDVIRPQIKKHSGGR